MQTEYLFFLTKLQITIFFNYLCTALAHTITDFRNLNISEPLNFNLIMGIYLSKEKVEEIFAEYGGSKENTGSTEGQIALFTFRVSQLSEHLKKHHGDHSTRRSLKILVGKRTRLLKYLAAQDITKYRKLIEKLGIRK